MKVVDFKISKIHIDFRPHKKEIYKISRFQKSRNIADFTNLGIIVDFRNLGFYRFQKSKIIIDFNFDICGLD